MGSLRFSYWLESVGILGRLCDFAKIILVIFSISSVRFDRSGSGYIEGHSYKEATVLALGQKTAITLFSGPG